MSKSSRVLIWSLVVAVASCGLCGVGTLALSALGLMAGDDSPGDSPAAPTAHAAAQPGAPGGFAFDPPQGWTSPGQGRVLQQRKEGDELISVEVIRLPAVPGLDGAEAKLAQLWTQRVGADWQGVTGTPLILRRFVSNGARAYFTAAELRPLNGTALTRVSLYLVEADDRLEPLVFIQGHADPTHLSVTQDTFARYSWNASHAFVEAAIAGVRGSPVGLPLVADEAITGRFLYSSGANAQWVNTLTGATSMTAVSYSVRYTFGEDHRYAYQLKGASGVVGAQRFDSEHDEGSWRVEHDQLILTADSGKTRKFLIVGAPLTPEGKRALYLLPEPQWSLAPGNLSTHGELYVAE